MHHNPCKLCGELNNLGMVLRRAGTCRHVVKFHFWRVHSWDGEVTRVALKKLMRHGASSDSTIWNSRRVEIGLHPTGENVYNHVQDCVKLFTRG